MGLLQIFHADQNDVRRSHVKNLVEIAIADGQLDPEEWNLLITIATTLGIPTKQIKEIKDHPEKVKFIPPKSHEERIQQIKDLVAIMTVDGRINEKELELSRKIALRLDILPKLVNDLINPAKLVQ
jgi:uncharacterized tellurite resistance protein B-like protein